MEPDLTIVGAGLTGLTAAIEAAERGWHVVVAEAHSQPAGRARSLPAPFRANTGPHAIYIDGPWWAWLERRGLTPPIVEASPGASLVMAGGQLGPWPAELSEAIAALPAGAPVQESFRSWLLRHLGTCAAEAIIGVVFIPTFDHGHELIQITAACSPRERKADAERRVHRLLDQAWPGWRAAVRWQRSCVRTHCTGAIDLPGTTWHDRPAISRSHTLAVATDQSAAPGLLAEAAITAAQLAVQQLGQTALASPSPPASLPRASACRPGNDHSDAPASHYGRLGRDWRAGARAAIGKRQLVTRQYRQVSGPHKPGTAARPSGAKREKWPSGPWEHIGGETHDR